MSTWEHDEPLECEFTALKSFKPQKKTVTLSSLGKQLSASYEQWFIADLLKEDCMNQIDIDSASILSYRQVLSACFGLITKSYSACALAKEASDKGWRIALEDLNGGEYWIDVDQKLLLLNNNALIPSSLGRSNYFRNIITVTLVKALRDIWQEKRHGGFDEQYRAEHILTMERVRSADCDVVSILVGWELRENDKPELWRHLIGSENGDLAMAFSSFMEHQSEKSSYHEALSAAFRQWYRCENRVNICDHNTLEYLDEVLNDCSEINPFGKKKPTKMNIEVLSCLPDKVAYLQGMGGDILSDPFYSGLDDPINQSHLLHILYDLEATIVENVPFRDADLARKIFPIETKADEITKVK